VGHAQGKNALRALMQLRCKVATIIAALTASAGASAEPSDYVLLPSLVQGERALELKLGSASGPGPRESVGSVSFEYAPTAFWVTEVYAQFARLNSQSVHFDAFEWENRFQLTEPGQYAVDWGLAAELEKPRDPAEGWHLRVGPLLQGSIDNRLQWNFNALIATHWSGDEASTTHLNHQWQLKYRMHPQFEFGVQGFGDFGPWYHPSALAEQFQNAGPAVFGRFRLGGRRVLYYNTAWLFGMTAATPSDTLRAQIELEF
jgi:hypothetical protein